MNPVPEKWRVTFAPAAQPGSVACARVAVPPDLEVWQDNNGNVCAYGYIADGYGWMDLVGMGQFRLIHASAKSPLSPYLTSALILFATLTLTRRCRWFCLFSDARFCTRALCGLSAGSLLSAHSRKPVNRLSRAPLHFAAIRFGQTTRSRSTAGTQFMVARH